MLPTITPKVFRLLLVLIFIIDFNYAEQIQYVKRYKLFYHEVNWMAAYVDCLRENMTLASIENSSENAEVAELFLDRQTSRDPHIGGTSQHDGREFVWISNGESVEYTNWASDEPDCWPHGCMVFYRYECTWAVDRCRYLRPFVCEYWEQC